MHKIGVKYLQKSKLSREERERLVGEIEHYLAMGCFDFTVAIGGTVVEFSEV